MSVPVMNSVREAMPGVNIEQGVMPGPNSQSDVYLFENEINRIASSLNTKVNLSEGHRFVEAYVVPRNLPGFRFVVSFHHIGAEYSGFMEVLSFVKFNETDAAELMEGPFLLSAGERFEALEKPFRDWLTRCFETALKKWRSKL
jgi:hypothetical protein